MMRVIGRRLTAALIVASLALSRWLVAHQGGVSTDTGRSRGRDALLLPSRQRSADVADQRFIALNVAVRVRDVCDFVAGMTDRYAMEFWARLKSDSAESMLMPI